MRSLTSLAAMLALSGCITGGGRTGPGTIPADAYGAMYTALPAEQVAACFTQAIGGTSQPQGTRFLVTSPQPQGATYDIGPNMASGDYPTEVIIRGSQNPVEQRRTGVCFVSLTPPS